MISKYEQFLYETFESDIPIKWKISDKKMIGRFKVGIEEYVIHTKLTPGCEDINSWYFKFYWNDGGEKIYSKTKYIKPSLGTNKFKIFATVINGLKYLIKLKNPDSIIFHADIYEDSRVKLYNSLIKKLIDNYPFKLTKFPFQYNDTKVLAYILYKNDLYLKRLRLSAKSIPTKWTNFK